MVERREGSVLVERVVDGLPWRGVLPSAALRADGTVSEGDLEAAIPHGVPWDEFDLHVPAPRELCAALRRRGIWTYDDLARNPLVARKAILALVMGASWGDLVRFAREARGGQDRQQ